MHLTQITILLIIGFIQGVLVMDWYRDKKDLKTIRNMEAPLLIKKLEKK